MSELEVSARKTSIQLGQSYPTTLKGFDILRCVILQYLSRSDKELKGEIDANQSYFMGKRKGKRGRVGGGKMVVFGILERGGKVSVKLVNDVSAEILFYEWEEK